MSKVIGLVGLGLAGVGLAHFAKPEVFAAATASAFPDDVDQHIMINGALETALGLALIPAKTRKVAAVGLLGYVGYLGANALKNRA